MLQKCNDNFNKKKKNSAYSAFAHSFIFPSSRPKASRLCPSIPQASQHQSTPSKDTKQTQNHNKARPRASFPSSSPRPPLITSSPTSLVILLYL